MFKSPIVKTVLVIIAVIVGLKIIVPLLPLPASLKQYVTI